MFDLNPPMGEPIKTLLVEDNVDAAETFAALLEMMGCEPRCAHTGAEGVAIAREWAPELVISDLGLPEGMDGFAVARALRSENLAPGAWLVALSGHGDEDTRRACREAGFDEHLTKPAGLDEIALCVERLRRSKSDESAYARPPSA